MLLFRNDTKNWAYYVFQLLQNMLKLNFKVNYFEPFFFWAYLSPAIYLLYVDFLCSFSLSYKFRRIATMDIIKVFGNNLKKYRTAMGVSQEAFAEKCGMHRTYISAIECYRRSISLENIQRIADALGIETYKLFLEE